MDIQKMEMHRALDGVFEVFPELFADEIPGIDLYMDQVTTFLQENLRGISRDPAEDKFLTKTMINNYVKNKVLFPPVKKKYSRDHMLLLIVIYYMKSFLSMDDIRTVTAPVMGRYAKGPGDQAAGPHRRENAKKESGQDGSRARTSHAPSVADRGGKAAVEGGRDKKRQADLGLGDVYDAIMSDIGAGLPRMHEEIAAQIDYAMDDFADAPEEDRPLLRRFSLICRLSAEVYVRKLFIQKLIDLEKEK